MNNLFDFDSLMDEYIENNLDYSIIDTLSEEQGIIELDKQYQKLSSSFKNASLKELDNKTPMQYFKHLSKSEVLNMFENYYKELNNSPYVLSVYLSDNISNFEDELIELYRNSDNHLLKLDILAVLNKANSFRALDLYLAILKQRKKEDELADIAMEAIIDLYNFGYKKEIIDALSKAFDFSNDLAKRNYLALLSIDTHEDRIVEYCFKSLLDDPESQLAYLEYISRAKTKKALDMLKEYERKILDPKLKTIVKRYIAKLEKDNF